MSGGGPFSEENFSKLVLRKKGYIINGKQVIPPNPLPETFVFSEETFSRIVLRRLGYTFTDEKSNVVVPEQQQQTDEIVPEKESSKSVEIIPEKESSKTVPEKESSKKKKGQSDEIIVPEEEKETDVSFYSVLQIAGREERLAALSQLFRKLDAIKTTEF